MKKIILTVCTVLMINMCNLSVTKADSVSNTPINFYSEKKINVGQTTSSIVQQQIDQYNQNISNTIQIDGVTFDSFVNSGKTAVVYVWFAECYHCEKFAPVLHKFIVDTGIPVYYLNLDNLGNINSNFIGEMQRFEINSTPTVFLLKHGKIIHHYVGDNITEDELMTLTKYHY